MKKLLILVLVLGLTSVASATISLNISGTVDVTQGDTLTVDVSSDSSVQSGWIGYVIVEEGGDGALSNPVIWQPHSGGGNAGNLAATSPYSESGWGVGYYMIAGATDSSLAAGVQFSVDYDTSALDVGDSCIVSLWDDGVGYETGDEQGIATINVVPEPATIALLGLGGLFLRRRK
jgi:hypothetical protein